MARPKKQTVDYFPHACIHKKTMFILEQKFSNDGYAFWFKLLELLGVSDGHFIDLKDETNWEFLLAKTRIDGATCTEILDLLARLDAIDRELWEEHKVVWSQNFVDGLDAVYQKRSTEKPVKPSFRTENSKSDDVSEVSVEKTPQSRVEKSREKESKEDILSPAASSSAAPYDKIVSLYHEHTPSLPKISRLSDKRKKAIRARWRASPDISMFEDLFKKAESSDFLTGRNGQWTGCNFDWLIKESNMLKVLEGTYDNRGSPPPKGGPPDGRDFSALYN